MELVPIYISIFEDFLDQSDGVVLLGGVLAPIPAAGHHVQEA